MRKARFTEEQIVGILKEADQGKKLRELEAENAKMKKLIANLSLDNMVLKDALGKK